MLIGVAVRTRLTTVVGGRATRATRLSAWSDGDGRVDKRHQSRESVVRVGVNGSKLGVKIELQLVDHA